VFVVFEHSDKQGFSLLDFQQMGIGEALFIRMLEYYKHLDPEAAADYWEYFDKME